MVPLIMSHLKALPDVESGRVSVIAVNHVAKFGVPVRITSIISTLLGSIVVALYDNGSTWQVEFVRVSEYYHCEVFDIDGYFPNDADGAACLLAEFIYTVAQMS